MWDELSVKTKLNILAGESTVMVGLLMENKDLMRRIKTGADKATCLNLINEQF